ncbi:hypothetical protein LN650_23135 [Klebsiella pneumoniae subsp. pneumoniae]|nr:hypothetical protein [Klebsiella pneumoniae subsp. pneumoniae]
MRALASIEDFNDAFDTHSFSDEEVDTIGGLVMHGPSAICRPAANLSTLMVTKFKVAMADGQGRIIQVHVKAAR